MKLLKKKPRHVAASPAASPLAAPEPAPVFTVQDLEHAATELCYLLATLNSLEAYHSHALPSVLGFESAQRISALSTHAAEMLKMLEDEANSRFSAVLRKCSDQYAHGLLGYLRNILQRSSASHAAMKKVFPNQSTALIQTATRLLDDAEQRIGEGRKGPK